MAGFQDKIMVFIDATSSGAVQEMDRLKKSTKDADLGVAALGKSLKTGLVAGAGAFVGLGMVAALNQAATAFQEAQVSASQFARATNATVQEAGKFTMVAKTLGLGMNDLIEINAEFSRKIKEQPQLLQQLNVQISKNADGSTNMTKTLVSTLDALGQMEDGLKAAQIAAQLFGEEGSKQLAGFYLAGIQVSDLMDRIDFVDKSDEAKEYAASTMELNLAFQQLQIEVGARLVPALTSVTDAGLALGRFLGGIPTSVYLAVGAFVALNRAMKFFRSELAANILIGTIDNVIAPLVGAFLEVEGAAAKAGVAIRGVGAAALAVSRIVVPLAALYAAFEALTFFATYSGDLRETTNSVDNLGLSLEGLAKAQMGNDGWFASFDLWLRATGRDSQELQYQMEDLADSLESQARATLANASATKVQKQAAQGLLDVIGSGSDAQKVSNLRTDQGTAAIKKYSLAMGGAAAVSMQLQESQKSLSDAVGDFILNGAEAETTWGDIAKAAITANNAALDSAQATNLIAIAQGQFATSIQGTVAWLDRLAAATLAPETGLNALQQTFKDWKADDPATWGNEWVIGFEKSKQDLVAQVNAWAAQGLTVAQITAKIEEIKVQIRESLPDTLTDDQKTAITDWITNTLIPGLGGKENEVPVPLTVTPEGVKPVTDTVTGLDLTTEVGVEAKPGAIDGLKTQLGGVAQDTTATITFNTAFSPDGYEAVKARADYLSQGRQGKIDVLQTFSGGPTYADYKARVDYLAQNRTATIDVKQTFSGGPTYDDYKRRIDYLSTNRSATVTITVKLAGTAAAIAAAEEAAGQSISVGAGAAAASRSANMMFSPINMVRVSLDGRELRSVIDDEIRALTPTTQEVA